jgi:hypothetical protein
MENFFNHLMDAEMHAGDLVQLSCLLAIYPPELNQNSNDCLEVHLTEYWAASRDRIDRWQFYLPRSLPTDRDFQHSLSEKTISQHSDRKLDAMSIVPLIVEMIISEPLSRVWAAILAGSVVTDVKRSSINIADQYGNVANHIFQKHSTFRQETMCRLRETVADPNVWEYLEKLASRILRWTDLLLAHIEQSHPASRFAPNPKRCLEFAEDLCVQLSKEHGQQTAALTIASARRAICEQLTSSTFSAQLNFKIGAAVLQSCTPHDLNPVGLLNPLWTVRLLSTLSHCETLLEESLDNQSTLPAPLVV